VVKTQAGRLLAASISVAVLGMASMAACAVPAPSAAAEALAYMRAHPVAPEAGMTQAVILTVDDVGFAGTAAQEARCPASLAAVVRGAAGSEPGCGAWSGTAETAAGQLASFSCGSIPARAACPLMLTASGYVPSPGDYVRIRLHVQIASPGDIQVITEFAVGSILSQAPDPGGPVFVTTPAEAGGA
jgi:hypothetical protein